MGFAYYFDIFILGSGRIYIVNLAAFRERFISDRACWMNIDKISIYFDINTE